MLTHEDWPAGIVDLIGVAAHAVPPTSVLGAIAPAGYLAGATATQIRVGGPWWFFPSALVRSLSCALDNDGQGVINEQRTSPGRNTQGCIRSHLGRQARKVGCQWPSFCGLGALSRQGIASGSESSL